MIWDIYIIAHFTLPDGFYRPRIFKQKRKTFWESLIPVQIVQYVNTPKYSFGHFFKEKKKKSTSQNASDKQEKIHLDLCEKYIFKKIKDL